MAGEQAILDDKMWHDFLKRVDTRVKNPQKVLATAYATRGYRDIIEHFTKEEGPSGSWKELAPSTLAKRGPGARILQDTGNLRQSISPTNYRGERDGIRVFAAAPYGGMHDRGGDRVPQRAFMWLSTSALRDMAKIILSLLVEK